MKRIFSTVKSTGFTILEMIVSIAIFTLITAVVLYNHSTFSNNIVVTNLAYQVALSLRQAQVYGLSSVGKNNGSGNLNFQVGYGVHFDVNNEDAQKSFVFFADSSPENKSYDGDCTIPASPTNECQEFVPITGGNKIDKICIVDNGATRTCSSSSTFQKLDVVFKRPNTEAYMSIDGDSSPIITEADIYLTSPQSKTKVVKVLHSGQISIDDPTL